MYTQAANTHTPHRWQLFFVGKAQLDVGVGFWQEDKKELENTLRGVAQNLEELRDTGGVPWRQVVVIIIVDGLTKINPTTAHLVSAAAELLGR